MTGQTPRTTRMDANAGSVPGTEPVRLRHPGTAVLLIDLQERTARTLRHHRTVVRRAGRLVAGANALAAPVLIAEQTPRALGATVGEIAAQVPGAVFTREAPTLSALNDRLRRALDALAVRAVVLAGGEAHTAVLHTALDLRATGRGVAVCHDAVSSRRSDDLRPALDRLTQAGVVPVSVESVLLELADPADEAAFRRLREVLRSD